MKLYRTKGIDHDDDTQFRWTGTQADAKKTLNSMKEEGYQDVENEDVDVPTSKPELLAWLNENATAPGK